MNKEELKKLKEDPNIKFIYKLPNSSYEEKIEYIIIGDVQTSKNNNIRMFSLDDWFIRMQSGSILPYVCSTLTRSGKIKEFLNIYEKPDLIKLRTFLLASTNKEEITQESLWGIQILKEMRVNRPDVFKAKCSPDSALKGFLMMVSSLHKKEIIDK